jgi:hypothetical protein
MINELLLRVEYEGSTYDLIVDNEVPLRIDMSAVESQELGKFFGIGSQTFNLPGTKETNRFFNYAYDVSTDDIPGFYNTLECSVILNGETVLIGALQLVSVVTNDEGYVTYQVQVVDKVLQFEELLASKLITNADWSPYNHIFTSQSIVDSWDDNLLSGSVYYPVVHYGYPQGESSIYPELSLSVSGSNLGSYINNVFTPMQPAQFLPAIRLKDCLDVVFDQVGFTYTGSFTETADFNNLYVLNKAQEGLGIIASGSESPTVLVGMGGQGIRNYQMQTSPNQWERVQYSSITSDPLSVYTTVCNDGLDSGSKYTATGTGEYTFTADISAFNPLWNDPGVEGVVEITLMKGTLPCGFSGGSGTTVATNSITLNSAYGFNTFTVGLEATTNLTSGEDVWVWIEWYATSGTPSSPSTDLQLGNFQNIFRCTAAPSNFEGATVDMAAQWQPDTKSIDFIRGLLQQFNLVMIPEVGNKSVIRIEQFDDWLRSGEIKDWTSKYDTAKRIKITHTVDELEKEVYLKSTDDVDRFSKDTIESAPFEQYGTLRLLADNTISQGEKTIGDYFAPVILGGSTDYNVSDPGARLTAIDYNTNFIYPHLYKFENSKLTSYAFKPRIGYKVSQNLTSDQYFYIGNPDSYITIDGSYSTISNVSSLPVTSATNDLHFNNTYTLFTATGANLNGGINAFNKYWKTYLDSLYWEGSKKIELDLFFNEYEYKDIQLNDRILIKGQAYRINKISGFNVSHRDVVKVELIKLYPAYWQL